LSLVFQSALFWHLQGVNPLIFCLVNLSCFGWILMQGQQNALAQENSIHQSRIQELEGDLLALSKRIHHDLREPIHGLNESLTHLLKNQRSRWNIEEKAGIRGIRERAERLSQVMENLQKIAEVQRYLPESEEVNMATCIAGALHRLAKPIQSIKPSMESAKEWPKVNVPAPWLEEVWFHLLSNALKYGGTPPVIRLGHQKQANGETRFWIEDSGDGVSPEMLPEFFNGLEHLTAGQSEGQGLGLALVKRIILKMGGSVGVDSSGIKGKGTRIYFSLPEAK